MYADFYQMTKGPFNVTPDPSFLFLSPSHKEALASIIYGIEKRKGFVAIIGEVGVGKTTVLRSYLETADRDRLKIVYVFNSNISFEDLVKTIYRDLGIDRSSDALIDLMDGLYHHLIEEYKKDSIVVLVIDEAQNMPIETLENLRMLSNLETTEDKLIQIVMVGQPEFQERLDLPCLRQLKQRIAIRQIISPLSDRESRDYIQHRLAKVAAHPDRVFTPGALRKIVKYSKGNPRVINILCDNALITGLGYQKKPVTPGIAAEVISGFKGRKNRRLLRPVMAFSAAAVIIIAIWMSGALHTLPPWLKNLGFHLNTGDKSISTHKASATEEAVAEPTGKKTADSVTAESTETGHDAVSIRKSIDFSKEAAIIVPEETHSSPGISESPPSSPSLQPSRASFQDFHSIEGLLSKKETPTRKPAAVPEQNRGDLVTMTVKKGDTLNKLISTVYGFTGKEVTDLVKAKNPNIRDVDVILPGEEIVFPIPPVLTVADQHQ